jgi:hypothetical protein
MCSIIIVDFIYNLFIVLLSLIARGDVKEEGLKMFDVTYLGYLWLT